MKKIFCLVVLLMACALINACEPCIEVETKETTLPIDVLHEGHYQHESNYLSYCRGPWVLHSEDKYENALTAYTEEYSETLDFSEGKVLLVDMGQQSTGGYSINVTSVIEYDHYVLAKVVLSIPGTNCMVTQAPSYHFQFVWIPSTKDLYINETLEINSCDE